jgi:chorismate mutase/prephenate dehydratase
MRDNDVRQKINRLDEQLVDLLNRRARLTQKSAPVKYRNHQLPYSPGREAEVLRRVKRQNSGPLPDEDLAAIYREIISASRKLQCPLRVAYWGPPGTNTHIAAIAHFGRSTDFAAVSSIPDVFYSVEKGVAHYGVVPVENSTEGVVAHTLDMFLEARLKICAEANLDIHHNLLSNAKADAEVKRVYCIGQAEAQCRRFLRRELSHAEIVPATNTAVAAQLAAKDKACAAIGTQLAAELYGLKILATNIEDNPHNQTRFLIVGLQTPEPTGQDRCSLLFSVPHKAGSLVEALNIFGKYGVNLTMIESRPAPFTAFEYVFFVDVEGHERDEKVSQAISALRQSALFVTILGSYPAAG